MVPKEGCEVGKFEENFSELFVLPAIDDDVDTGVQDQQEVGEGGASCEQFVSKL